MKTKTIDITEITVDELAEKVAGKLLEKIKNYIDELHKNENEVYLTRKETAEFLKIDSSTLWHWTKKGKINSYGLGNRRYYNKKELIDILKRNELRV